jgi:uncharacterized protein
MKGISMADYDNRIVRTQTTARADLYDAGLRAYMLRVYNYMMIGLAVTGLTAYGVFGQSFVTDPESGRMMVTSLGQLLFVSPLRWVVMLAPLGVVFLLGARLQKMSLGGAQASFWIFSGLMGLSLATIFVVFTGTSIAKVFFITAATFGALSLYGYTTSKSLSGWGSFLMMGLFGIIIASLVNIFFHSTMMSWLISIVGVGVFAGLTAYDTQRIKEMYSVYDDGTAGAKIAIMGALSLYLDFINLFISLLQLLGDRR